MESSDRLKDIREYERTRYRGLDQRIVHGIEKRIVTGFIRKLRQDGDRVIDIPCGYGRFTSFLVDEPLEVYVGDLSHLMLLRVKERFNSRVRMARGDIMELPFADNSFDGLLSMRLFQHFHTPAERITGFSEIARVVSRWAVVSVYTCSTLHKLMRMFREHHKITMASVSQITEELEKSGLRLLKMKKIMPGLHAQTILMVEPK